MRVPKLFKSDFGKALCDRWPELMIAGEYQPTRRRRLEQLLHKEAYGSVELLREMQEGLFLLPLALGTEEIPREECS